MRPGVVQSNRPRLQRGLRLLAVVLALLVIAGCGRSRVVREGGRAPAPGGERPVKVSTPKYGATTIVQRGQNVYRIATENGITALDLALWNDIPPPYTIYPGQRLRLYPGGQRGVATRTSKPPPRTQPSPSTRPPAATSRPAPPAALIASNIGWRWPADGSVIGTYAEGNPTRQGIDIAGASGRPVRATADGVVVYSGSGLVGYGELVIVKHNDQWLSAYGHNRARLVNEGQLVKAGQQIAEMGRSGASRDMLHFEIRYNGKPVDPQLYLPRR